MFEEDLVIPLFSDSGWGVLVPLFLSAAQFFCLLTFVLPEEDEAGSSQQLTDSIQPCGGGVPSCWRAVDISE